MKNQGISEFTMVNVGEKPVTRRECLATGKFFAKPSTIHAIREGLLPKGNALPLAEAAGILAVKKTSEILPLCHPLPVDAASVTFSFDDACVTVHCRVTAHAKTGVEMEALSGVSASLLCIYDLAKGIDSELELGSIQLLEKSGGKSGTWRKTPDEPNQTTRNAPWKEVRAAIITLSDRCARGETEDQSGPALAGFLTALGARVVGSRLIPDDAEELRTAVEGLITSGAELVLTTGGTGVGPRDITPETLQTMAKKHIPGFGERMRSEGLKKTHLSPLSRSGAYLIRGSLVISLPGSPKGAVESLEAVASLIPHALKIQKGASHP
ncbi:MAG: bifunctional molybdenum cofactor biosynthesis protein MoaC/MoaB [Bdellovibrionales bacterium]|nr:bifunctional molybdenum cofactor biosynthesis protein MoaC/MoaB [Bdellovibrionales bacterium]